MKRIVLAAGAALLLTACGGGEEAKLAKACNGMLGNDPEVTGDLTEDGKTLDDYCSCYATAAMAESDANRAAIIKVTETFASLREERNLGVEAVAEMIENDRAGDAYAVTEVEFKTTGKFVDTVRRDLRKGEGVCAL